MSFRHPVSIVCKEIPVHIEIAIIKTVENEVGFFLSFVLCVLPESRLLLFVSAETCAHGNCHRQDCWEWSWFLFLFRCVCITRIASLHRVAKTNRMPYWYICSQQSPVISGSFVKTDLQFKDVLRHPMGLRHPVMRSSRYSLLRLECHVECRVSSRVSSSRVSCVM